MKVGVIIPAAGSGVRMGGVRKPFLEVAGQSLLQRCLASLAQVDNIAGIVVALPADVLNDPPDWLRVPGIELVAGGSQRADSVRAALAALPADVDVVVVHDAARPFVTPAMIRAVIELASTGVSATIAVPVTDTLHRVDENGAIVETPDRAALWRAQTPQAFPRDVLQQAFARMADASTATDEAGLVARAGFPVRVVAGADDNIKVTAPADLALAELIWSRREA